MGAGANECVCSVGTAGLYSRQCLCCSVLATRPPAQDPEGKPANRWGCSGRNVRSGTGSPGSPAQSTKVKDGRTGPAIAGPDAVPNGTAVDPHGVDDSDSTLAGPSGWASGLRQPKAVVKEGFCPRKRFVALSASASLDLARMQSRLGPRWESSVQSHEA